MHYDKIIIGAGLYGLYSAELCGRQGDRYWSWNMIMNLLHEQPTLIRQSSYGISLSQIFPPQLSQLTTLNDF